MNSIQEASRMMTDDWHFSLWLESQQPMQSSSPDISMKNIRWWRSCIMCLWIRERHLTGFQKDQSYEYIGDRLVRTVMAFFEGLRKAQGWEWRQQSQILLRGREWRWKWMDVFCVDLETCVVSKTTQAISGLNAVWALSGVMWGVLIWLGSSRIIHPK